MKPLLLATALLLTACGPTYHTNYTLNEPATESAKLCSANVISMSNTCVANCQMMARSCYSPGGFSTNISYGRGFYEPAYGYSRGITDDRDCSPRGCEENCLAAARQGHVSCGGTVTSEVVCTANCPKPVIVTPQ